MAVNVISRRALVSFWTTHPQAEGPLTAWYTLVSKGDWSGPQALRAIFGSVDFVADNRAIFNIGGNAYRIIVRFAYSFKTAQIKFVGTHAEYDLIDAATVGNPKAKNKRRRKKALTSIRIIVLGGTAHEDPPADQDGKRL